MIELTCTLSEQIREYTLGTNPRVCYFINLRRFFWVSKSSAIIGLSPEDFLTGA